ncbi:reverse transcriptase family protein [Ferruginibacter sp. SUN106]|uniref:reverse transcriptase family protein n=1 Tax=Ferruginibacter sp. SUN106 TaxID=2978348 RepID=UPI003D35AC39
MIKSLPNLYSFLRLPEKIVSCITKNIGNYYLPKLKPKKKYGDFQRDNWGNIKYRELFVPDFILKSRQQYIARLLNQVHLPHYMYGSIEGKNNIQNAQQHLNKKYFLTIDLKNFFTNINHHQVYKMFYLLGFSPSVSRVLTQLTTYQASLPQGAPSSPVIANLIFLNTADKLYALAKSNNITFTTFLDDLTFSSNYDFKDIVPKIISFISDDRFQVAYEKIHYRKDYCEITGLFVKGGVLELPYVMQNKVRLNYCLRAYKNLVQQYNQSAKAYPL